MSTAVADKQSSSFQRPVIGAPIFTVTGPVTIAILAGTTIDTMSFNEDTVISLTDPKPGTDYAVRIEGSQPMAYACSDGVPADAIGGFHYALGGNAAVRAGGDDQPAINPFSCWDAGFRPTCPDPRSMALVDQDGLRFWCDIYLLGVDHLTKGTSRFGETIADGDDLPATIDGKGKVKRCDFPTVQAIYAHHGKQLLTYDEFRAAAFGVTEKSAADDEPETTGLDAARTSRFGIMQATGNMWVWGTDGDPDEARPGIFGGSWIDRSHAGSRCAYLDYWPDNSHGDLSARGRSDHLEA
jgi:hypothetical protein